VGVRPLYPSASQYPAVQIVSKEALNGVEESSGAVRRAIERRRKDPALFDDVYTCVRAKGAK
jgi:hypothetical protein